MQYLLLFIWLLAAIIYLRSSLQAIGRVKKKLFEKDGFLLGQQIIACLLALQAALAFIFSQKIIAYGAIANLIIDFLFYLQPTPRTTKKILWVFIILNIIFALLFLMS